MTTRSILIGLGILSFGTLRAAEISKANNTQDLALGGSWIGNTAPGPNDVAMWDYQFTQTLSTPLTSDVAWAGIKLNKWASKRCIVQSPDPLFTELSLGALGIVSTKETATENAVSLTTDVLCTADQSWTAIPNTSAQILITGGPHYDDVLYATANYVDLGGHTITVNNFEVRINGNNPSDMSLKNGSLILNNSSLRVNSGGRWKSSIPVPIFSAPSSLSIQVNAGSRLLLSDGYSFSENLVWNAAVTLNGGTFEAGAPGVGIIGIPGSSGSNDNTVGGSIAVTEASTISLSSEIGAPKSSGAEVIHNIAAPLTGSSSLSVKNHSLARALNLITFSGDNSGFTGQIGIVGEEGIRTARLSSDTAGSAAASWTIGGENVLEIENSDVSLGSLTGSGTLLAMGGGTSTARIGGGSFQGLITQNPDSTLHFHKVGATTQTYRGTTAWNGDTFVDEGTLTLTKPCLDADTTVTIAEGATLGLSHSKVDGVEALVIDGDSKSAGTWGAEGSDAQFTSASITGSGMLFVSGTDPYLKWTGEFPDLTDPEQRALEANPDLSLLNNMGEFAFGGDPTDPSNDGAPIQTALDPDFRYIIPVRTGAVFTQLGSEMVSAPIDGIIYRVQASLDLNTFTTPVLETPFFDPELDAEPLPEGWDYRSFETDIDAGDTPRQFIRTVIEAAP